jgi:hypothetical protein
MQRLRALLRRRGLELADVKGSSYGPTIKAQLDEERATKNSLEARGIGIITTSGVLATLIFGLVTFTRGNVNQPHLAIVDTAKWALIAAVVLFSLAALLGLAANLPWWYREALISVLEERVKPEEWSNPDPIEAARYDAVLNVQILKAARKVNGWKAWAVLTGLASEAVAAVAVAVAVGAELYEVHLI